VKFTALVRQAIKGDKQAALLMGNLCQVVGMLALVAGQQRRGIALTSA
jgi:hypothetical protein